MMDIWFVRIMGDLVQLHLVSNGSEKLIEISDSHYFHCLILVIYVCLLI